MASQCFMSRGFLAHVDKEPSRAKIIGVVGRQENESGVENVAHMARAALVLRSQQKGRFDMYRCRGKFRDDPSFR